MRHSTLTDQVVVITGANGGFGQALATALAAKDARLALIARKADIAKVSGRIPRWRRVPDETWGEIVVAFVQARPGATVDVRALTARCAESLSGYKRPKRITILETLPKNAVGKLDKSSLRSLQRV